MGAAGTAVACAHAVGSAVGVDGRQLIDGIRWRVRVGAPWPDVPDCYGSWRAVSALFRRWRRAGASAEAVAIRYDNLAVRYEATLHIAVINDWLLTSL